MKTHEEIHAWLREKIAVATHTDPGAIETDAQFTNYGLDSIVIVTLVDDMEVWLGVTLDPTIFWEYPTIEELTNWLIEKKLAN
jgi:acyl carrier protein